MIDTQNALFANEAFYLAFTERDIDAMDGLWAQRAPVVCVHPGWPALNDRTSVMESWRRILTNPAQPGMDFLEPQCHAYPGIVLVTCYEQLPGGTCVATNGFVDESGAVRMVLHHASACAAVPGSD